LGGFVREGGRLYHLGCYLKPKLEAEYQRGRASIIEEENDKKRVALDREQERQEQERAALMKLHAKGKALWTREDRAKLVEARIICVHCGDRPPRPGGKHCSPCYMASQYGETEMAQTAAKSAESVAKAAEVLKGVAVKEERPVEKKPEEKKVVDRFALLDLD
jgi:hypothetical protein